jgi:DNA primase
MNVLDLAQRKVQLKKAASTNGGEWQGPCPACGGTDRFHVWPVQNESKGAYWCRSCGKAGDNIQYLRDFEGMSFRDACATLNITLPDHRQDRPSPAPQRTKPEFTPEHHVPPADLWQERAEKFLAWAQAALENNNEALSWLAGRGIDAVTARNARLGWNAGEKGKDIYRPRKAWGLPDVLKDNGKPKMLWIPQGLVIPYIIEGVIHRLRIRRPEGEPRYYVLPGSSMSTMIIGRDRRAFVVVESELDAIAAAAATDLAGAVALGSVAAKPDAETYAVLQSALQVLNALDYGDIGGGAKAAEKAIAWWTEHFPEHHDRWPVPRGKDPGEAFKMGIDLKGWIQAGLPPALTISYDPPRRETIPGKNETIQANAETTAPEAGTVREEKERPAGGAEQLPATVRELCDLLRKNQGVKIINLPERYTVLRNGKYVGGRINELVFRDPDVLEYIGSHPSGEIDGVNFFYGG